MATIVLEQPDSLSFSQNLKKFVISSDVVVLFLLMLGTEQILNETYYPDTDNIVEIDLRAVIDRILLIELCPVVDTILEQTNGVAGFTATIGGVTTIDFRVVKGGVKELQETATTFLNSHFLSWQIQDKKILQYQPEWLTFYTNGIRIIKVKAYYADNTSAILTLHTIDGGKLFTIDVSWSAINAAMTVKDPVAWDVWIEDGLGTRLSYLQRYQLRNQGEKENIFLWANTLGGIDSVAFIGFTEDNKKLEFQSAELWNGSLDVAFDEYNIDKKREIKQSTGYLSVEESRWLEDFFYSKKRYKVDVDRTVRPIVMVSSQLISSTIDDLFDYEFSYRMASDNQLLNLDRAFETLQAPEGFDGFCLAELLDSLPTALYSDNLLLAVQSPFTQNWQKMSMAQLWDGAMPALVDSSTITFVDGKLKVVGTSGGIAAASWEEIGNRPTTLLGYGITDASLSTHAHYYDQIGDSLAENNGVAINTINRKIIYGNVINVTGYISRIGLGLKRGADGWGTGLLSIGINDAGTAFTDYQFESNGNFIAPLSVTAKNGGFVTYAGDIDYISTNYNSYASNTLQFYIKNSNVNVEIGNARGSLYFEGNSINMNNVLNGTSGIFSGGLSTYGGLDMCISDITRGRNATFSGNITAGGTIQFYTASDIRLKKDFEFISDPIGKIKSLTGYNFNYTDEAMKLGGYTNRRDIGLIAQDVQRIIPEAVSTLWGTQFIGYKSEKIIPLLVEAIKAQQIEIEQLKMNRA